MGIVHKIPISAKSLLSASVLFYVAAIPFSTELVADPSGASCGPLPPGMSCTPGNKTVQGLLANCTSSDSRQQIYCFGMVSGAGGVMSHFGLVATADKRFQNLKHDSAAIACGNWSDEAAVQAFKNWAEKHPEGWNENAVAGIMVAISETWPCK